MDELTRLLLQKILCNDEQKIIKDELTEQPYVICRTYSAGVQAGYLEKRKGKEVTLINSRRIYYWDGAATLSQLAMDGTSKPDNCKFPCAVNKIDLTEVIEIISCTDKAKKSIEDVKTWQE